MDYQIRVATAGPGAVVAVLLHGRGSDASDMLGLARGLPAEWTVVAPEAPFPAAPWGYGPGRAWYRYLGEDVPEPESFARSLDEIGAFLHALPDVVGFDPGTVLLGGFSQGGTSSLGYALSVDDAPPVVNFSGFLAQHPRVRLDPASAQHVRVFWGHGTRDPNIPFELARAGRARLEEAGVKLTAQNYVIGHWIDAQELRDAVEWAEALRAVTRPASS